jgi:tetratricopeptide (TPR) repeat protein
MIFRVLRRFMVFLPFLCLISSAQAQVTSKAETKPDYSKEAFVIEQTSTRITFENDGTSTRESSARVRIQSEAGVQRYGLLTFSYQNSTESLDIDYVRVHKPDGSLITTSAENTQDMAAEITREAPFYSDVREKHVAVRGLGVGDTLEYQAHWRVNKPLAPGQFWYAYNFAHDSIILEERLQISVPRDRPVKWKSPDLRPTIAEDGARRVFSWTSSQLEHKSAEQEKIEQETKLYQMARGQFPPSNVQLSTFQSWEEVGRWYGSLQEERVKPTPEIRAKAAELTKGASDDNAKLRAIYKYVSTEFRYIGIAFGIGRYQPHTAAEVLANQYGDCKDKHTLFASLLDAAGIKAYPALISSSHDIDLDVPSPGQFDHVIGVVPQASSFLWFDTTTEVAPFTYLVRPLRDKRALVILEDKPPTLMTTPADPPSKASQTFKITAKLDDTGTLTGKIERTVQGDDSEVLLRNAFRRVPMPQWKDLIQQISYGSGFAGDVSEVTASSPEKTDEPFHFAYVYTRKDYPNWSGRQISSPLPPTLGLIPDSKPSHPILLGEPGNIQYESHVELPKGYSPELPGNVDLKEDFAEYHATYAVKDGVLTTERHFVLKRREVPISDYDAFKKFAKVVGSDHDGFVSLSSNTNPASTAPSPRRSVGAFETTLSRLPDSVIPEASSLVFSAQEAMARRDLPSAVAAVKSAVAADPHFARAWVMLGSFLLIQRQRDAADEAFHSAMNADPKEPFVYKAIAYVYMGANMFDDAIALWQDLIKMTPDDADGHTNLGSALLAEERYPEAAAAFESAVKLGSATPDLYTNVGYAYLYGGENSKAVAAFQKVIELDPAPHRLNDIAYTMSNSNGNLPVALDFAEKAVRGQEEATQQLQASQLKAEDLVLPVGLAAFWDTLGWIHFRMGNNDLAEKYLNASWALWQDSEVAGHLGQVYQAQGKKTDAMHMYRLALSASPNQTSVQARSSGLTEFLRDMRQRIEDLGGDADAPLSKEADELRDMSVIRLPRLMHGTESAEFFVVFVPASKAPGFQIESLTFISGSEKMKTLSQALKPDSFKVLFPDQTPTRILRRGILGCFEHTGCSFILMDPKDVRSVK